MCFAPRSYLEDEHPKKEIYLFISFKLSTVYGYFIITRQGLKKGKVAKTPNHRSLVFTAMSVLLYLSKRSIFFNERPNQIKKLMLVQPLHCQQ